MPTRLAFPLPPQQPARSRPRGWRRLLDACWTDSSGHRLGKEAPVGNRVGWWPRKLAQPPFFFGGSEFLLSFLLSSLSLPPPQFMRGGITFPLFACGIFKMPVLSPVAFAKSCP